jgi:hypothetical protein
MSALPVLNQFLFLDMWATATASILGGPWYGAIIGCLTNLTGDVFFGGQYLNYAPVSVWGAIIWGALAHRWGLGPFIPPEHKPNLYRQLTIRILINGLVVGGVCVLLVMAILDDFSGWITVPPADAAAKEHPAVLMLRIFYDYFEKVGLAEYGLIDTARSRMSDLLTLPMHLVMTIPDQVFSASLAFYIAICIARKSGYAEWRLAGRKPYLHPIFSPVAFVCIYPAMLAAHVAINHPGFDVEKLPHYCLWLSPLLAAAPALRSALRGGAAVGRKKPSVDDHPGTYRLLITHIFSSQSGAQCDVGEAGYPTPHDNISGRRIIFAREIATKARNLDQVGAKSFAVWRCLAFIVDELVKQVDFCFGQGNTWRRFRCRTVDHRHPENTPAQDAEDGDQVHEPFSGSQLRIFCLAARLQDLMKDLDLPAHRVPFKFFNDILAGLDR